jgi:hypothetical protein
MFQHARGVRLADGADEVYMMRIAQRAIAAFNAFKRPEGRRTSDAGSRN